MKNIKKKKLPAITFTTMPAGANQTTYDWFWHHANAFDYCLDSEYMRVMTELVITEAQAPYSIANLILWIDSLQKPCALIFDCMDSLQGEFKTIEELDEYLDLENIEVHFLKENLMIRGKNIK